MRTPKRLYAQPRLIYQPEFPTCPHCGEVLILCNYLAWEKTVQTLDQGLSVASRPGRCPQETCPGSHMRLLSAQAQRLACPGSTYGYDVLVRIGWLRSQARATYREIHRAWHPRCAFRSPIFAISTDTFICRYWPVMSVNTATTWRRSPTLKAA